jgi:hypothetical protein
MQQTIEISKHRAELIQSLQEHIIALGKEPAVVRFQTAHEMYAKEIAVLALETEVPLPNSYNATVAERDGKTVLVIDGQ